MTDDGVLKIQETSWVGTTLIILHDPCRRPWTLDLDRAVPSPMASETK